MVGVEPTLTRPRILSDNALPVMPVAEDRIERTTSPYEGDELPLLYPATIRIHHCINLVMWITPYRAYSRSPSCHRSRMRST
jgi:hypothetical protein